MDTSKLQDILAEMYGCAKQDLGKMYQNMTPEIAAHANGKLGTGVQVSKKVTTDADAVYA